MTLLMAATRLAGAEDDAEREDALMSAAEGVKAALDRKKFGE
jgi:hypothetical protein